MERKIRTLVVGVSEMQEQDPHIVPPGEDPVLAPAAALAERLEARLHVVQAFERPDPLGSVTAPLHTAAALQQRRVEIERRLWAQTRRFPNGERVHCHAVEGNAAIQFCGFAEEVHADLLVVGASRRGWMWQNILGGTAERVLRRSTIPVLVVRRPFVRPIRRVLLTTDLSELSGALHEAGLGVVEALCGTEPLELRTLLVCWYDRVTSARVSRELMTQVATARLDEFLARQPRGQRVERKVRIGNPSTEILRETGEWQADLLVLGSHGRWGISRWMLGSTAAAALRGTSCNALVIPAAWAASRAAAEKLEPPQAKAGFPGTEEHQEEGGVLTASA
jgi:nucleotide-binding universal stress UspA family protein